jgi:hypothetical protein
VRTHYRLLQDNLVHGDQRAIADAIPVAASKVNLWCQPPLPDGMGQPSPVDRYIRLIEAVRSTGNVEGADRIFISVADELGFVAYKVTEGYSDDADFAGVLREFADFVDERANAEAPDSPGGRIRTPEERRAMANKAMLAAAALLKFGDDQIELADAEERQPIRRRA